MTDGQLNLPLVNLHPHLRLPRQAPTGERQRRAAARPRETVYTDRPGHAANLRRSLDQLRAIHASRNAVLGVTPESVAVLRCNRIPEESFLRAADLQVLDRFPDRIVVASIADPDLQGLRVRLERYAASAADDRIADEAADQDVDEDEAPSEAVPGTEHVGVDAALQLPRNATYKDLFDCVDEITDFSIEEVITPALADAILSLPSDAQISVDVQCWCPEEEADARRRNEVVREAIVASGGLVRDSTVRSEVGLSLIRAAVPVAAINDLASLDHVRRIDVLPHPDLMLPEVRTAQVGDLPLVLPPSDDSPVVAIIDSGIREGHPLLAPAVVEASSVAGISDSEVFSTDWSFGGGEDECCFGDGADPLRAQPNVAQRFPAGLQQRDSAFPLSA